MATTQPAVASELSLLPGSRSAAREAGARYYFTGVRCENGHLDKRYTPNGHCMECDRERAREKRRDPEFRAKDAERLREMNVRMKAADPVGYAEREREKSRRLLAIYRADPKWQARQRQLEKLRMSDPVKKARKDDLRCIRAKLPRVIEARRQRDFKRYHSLLKTDPRHIAERKLRAKVWVERNRDKANAKTAARRAMRKRAVPAFLTEQMREEMLLMYAVARRVSEETGVPHEIDHEVPLKHDLVCGLHTPDNLQLLTCVDNRAKANNFLV